MFRPSLKQNSGRQAHAQKLHKGQIKQQVHSHQSDHGMEHRHLQVNEGGDHEDGGGAEEAQVFHQEEIHDGEHQAQGELQGLEAGEHRVHAALHAELPGRQDHLEQVLTERQPRLHLWVK